MLHGEQVVVWSSEDLKGCFYLLKLPRSWAPSFAFDQRFSLAELGLPPSSDPGDDGERWLGAVTLPMGWLNAMGIAQYVHRRWTCLARGDPLTEARLLGLPLDRELRKDRAAAVLAWDSERLRALWQIYCDDLDIIELQSSLQAARAVEGSTNFWHEAMRRAYGDWQAVLSSDKANQRQLEVKRLGAQISGQCGRVGPAG